MTNLKSQISNLKSKFQGGFTLIELMVAISITAVLGTLGIAGFVNYNQTQVLQTASNEVVTMLNLAKSRAQSQIKPSSLCSTGVLAGYVVTISIPRRYTLYLRCSIDSAISDIEIDEQDKSLPTGLDFNSSPDSSIFFPVQAGGALVSGADDNRFVITDSGEKTKTIIVNSLGGVSVSP